MDSELAARLFSFCILLLPILLLGELLLLRSCVTASRTRALLCLDLTYNGGIYLAATAALVHLIWFGRGLLEYLISSWLYVALGLFVLLSVFSLLPITLYTAWRAQQGNGQALQVSSARLSLLRLCLVLEVVTILAIGYLAALIEHGQGPF